MRNLAKPSNPPLEIRISYTHDGKAFCVIEGGDLCARCIQRSAHINNQESFSERK